MKCLTVRNPWAWAIIRGGKDIENRDWYTGVRGLVAIHASKTMTRGEYDDAFEFCAERELILPSYSELLANFCGRILGTVHIVDCVRWSQSQWFQGEYGFVLSDPRPLELRPEARGHLGFWEVEPNLDYCLRHAEPKA